MITIPDASGNGDENKEAETKDEEEDFLNKIL